MSVRSYRKMLSVLLAVIVVIGGSYCYMEWRAEKAEREASVSELSGDLLIPGGMPVGIYMVTDGVMDALPEGSQEEKLVEFIRETDIVNPTEFARGILSQVLKSSGGMPMDDMTVLVIGIWGLS